LSERRKTVSQVPLELRKVLQSRFVYSAAEGGIVDLDLERVFRRVHDGDYSSEDIVHFVAVIDSIMGVIAGAWFTSMAGALDGVEQALAWAGQFGDVHAIALDATHRAVHGLRDDHHWAASIGDGDRPLVTGRDQAHAIVLAAIDLIRQASRLILNPHEGSVLH
jgi:hypothetical protein